MMIMPLSDFVYGEIKTQLFLILWRQRDFRTFIGVGDIEIQFGQTANIDRITRSSEERL